MAVVYLKEQGAYVKKVSERLSVEKAGNSIAEIPVNGVTNLSVIGNVQVTTQALQMLFEQGVDISWFSYSGKYLGTASADSSKNIFLRFEQYGLYNDTERRLEMAREIVRNKTENQISFAGKFRYADGYSPVEDIGRMRELLGKLSERKTSNEIMGVEGTCSAIYFGAFSHMLKCDIKFEKRNRRPPRDPVNVILSLGYTLLTKEISSILESESFETYLGFLHGIRYGRRSLALDIVEEFRQPVVDRLTIRMFNKRMIDVMDFDGEEDRILLTESGFRKFCTAYEKWLKQPVSEKEPRSFRKIMRDQAAELKRAVREHEPYRPYRWGAESDVSDNL